MVVPWNNFHYGSDINRNGFILYYLRLPNGADQMLLVMIDNAAFTFLIQNCETPVFLRVLDPWRPSKLRLRLIQKFHIKKRNARSAKKLHLCTEK